MTPPRTDIHSRIQELISAARVILVTGHRDCDGDSVGGQLAMTSYLKSLGKQVVTAQHGQVQYILKFLPGIQQVMDITDERSRSEFTVPDSFDLVITLECPNPDRIGEVRSIFSSDTEIINIDHHSDNSNYGEVNWVDSSASSVCEMVEEFFDAVKFNYDRDTATALYTGILTDTGRFHYSSATARTFKAVSRIVSRGIDIQKICDQIYFSRSAASIKLTGLALSQIAFHADSSVCVIPISLDMFKQAGASQGDTEGIVEYTLYTEAARVGALIRQIDQNSVKVSLRSRGTYDMAKVAQSFGGGGHRNAAGCLIHDTLENAINSITRRLIEVVGK